MVVVSRNGRYSDKHLGTKQRKETEPIAGAEPRAAMNVRGEIDGLLALPVVAQLYRSVK